jgi:hypothetical protein
MIRQMTDGPEGLKILLPLPRLWPVSFFLGLWLWGWGRGEWRVAGELLRAAGGGFHSVDLFLALWLALWTVGGAAAIFCFLVTVAGEEEITCDGRTLAICWGVFGYGLRKRFPVESVEALGRADVKVEVRRGAKAGTAAGPAATPPAFLRGLLVFRAQGKTIPFGWKLTESEAGSVLARLRSRHAFPAPPSSLPPGAPSA